jgi:DNA polymerase I
MLENTYCLNFMQERSFSKFIIKHAKKRYFGIERDGHLLVKGFNIVQHSTPKKVKIILQDIFRDLIEQKLTTLEIREKLLNYKKEFKNFNANELGIELRLANNPKDYDTKVPHAVAAEYSNKYLGTNFSSNSIGKFLFVKNVGSIKYPPTEYVFLDEDSVLPIEFVIDYEKMWDKLVIAPLLTLKELDDLQIEKITSQNKLLEEFLK